MEFLAGLYTLLLVTICLLLAAVLWKLNKPRNGGDYEELKRWMQQQLDAQAKDFAARQAAMAEQNYTAIRSVSETLQTSVQSMSTTLAQGQSGQQQILTQRLQSLEAANTQKLEELRKTLAENMTALQAENAKKLDEIRHTVDEQLQDALQKRVTESFKAVNDQLEQVYKGLGEMQNLAADVGGLKQVLSGVKTRGILGEIQLGAILEEILAPEQYETNVATIPGSTQRVEYAIKMPGADGGTVVSQGSVDEVARNDASIIGPFLSGAKRVMARSHAQAGEMFDLGRIHLESSGLHTVKPFSVDIPRGRLIAVTGVSGSGKTTLVLETLIPALTHAAAGEALPEHVTALAADGIKRANLIDATPIGINVRSTVATYCGALDDLRRAYARTEGAKTAGLKAGDFSYNTGSLRCATCDGTGQISLDVQFLPDVDIACPDCRGSRYSAAAEGICRPEKGAPCGQALSLPALLSLSVDEALAHVTDIKKAHEKLQTLHDLGLGYLTLGEATPALSGGEAQRLKLASEMGRGQEDAVFVFDEPTIGLDAVSKLQLRDFLLSENHAHGTTIMLTTHDMEDISALCRRVLVLGHGKKLFDGELPALLARYDTMRTLRVRYAGEITLPALPESAAETTSMPPL